jgi:hypothetical protein
MGSQMPSGKLIYGVESLGLVTHPRTASNQ